MGSMKHQIAANSDKAYARLSDAIRLGQAIYFTVSKLSRWHPVHKETRKQGMFKNINERDFEPFDSREQR